MLPIGVIKRAIQEAEKSTYKVKIGAVIFKGSRIISSGHNKISSSTIKNKYRVWKNSVHAEQDALNNSKVSWKDLKGCSILIIKVSKALGLLSNAHPCSMCGDLINHVGLKNIYYSTSNGEICRINKDEIIKDWYIYSK